MEKIQEFVVDRIEGDHVVLVNSREQIIIPRKKFKVEINEGDVINLADLSVNKVSTRNKKRRVNSLLENLFK